MNFTIAVMTQMKCITLIDDIRFADVRSKMHDALLDYMDKIRDPFRSYQWSLRPWRKDARTALDGGRFVHVHKMAIRQLYATMTPAYRHKGGEGGGEKTEVLTIMPADDHPAGIIQAA